MMRRRSQNRTHCSSRSRAQVAHEASIARSVVRAGAIVAALETAHALATAHEQTCAVHTRADASALVIVCAGARAVAGLHTAAHLVLNMYSPTRGQVLGCPPHPYHLRRFPTPTHRNGTIRDHGWVQTRTAGSCLR